MTFPKPIIQKIITLWGKGASAEETVKFLKDEGIKISLHGVYNLRHSLTANQIIDEDIRAQRRAINTASTFDPKHPQDYNPALAMKYRDKLLDKLMPHNIAFNQTNITQNKAQVVNNNGSYISEYEAELARAVEIDIQDYRSRKSLDSTQATS